MKIKKVDWYGLDHVKVAKEFEGNPVFLNYFCVRGEPVSSAVYKVMNPNRKKGHKDYLTLKVCGSTLSIGGLTKEEMEKERHQSAIWCRNCNTVLYSADCHHFNSCDCDNEAFVDGGRSYLRYGAKYPNKIKIVTIDLLEDYVIIQ